MDSKIEIPKDSWSANINIAPRKLQTTEIATKTAVTPGGDTSGSGYFPSCNPPDGQTLHVVLLNVSSPTVSPNKEMRNFKHPTSISSPLKQHHVTPIRGNLNTTAKDTNEIVNDSNSRRNTVTQISNSCNKVQRIENIKELWGESKCNTERGNDLKVNTTPVCMGDPIISRRDNTSGFYSSDLSVLPCHQTAQPVPTAAMQYQPIRKQINVRKSSTPYPMLKSSSQSNVRMDSGKSVSSVTSNVHIHGSTYLENSTTVRYPNTMTQGRLNCSFSPAQIGINVATSPPTLMSHSRPYLVMAPMLNQESRASHSNMNPYFMPQATFIPGLSFPSTGPYMPHIENNSKCIDADRQIRYQLRDPNLYPTACTDTSQQNSLCHSLSRDNLNQFQRQTLVQQTQPLSEKQNSGSRFPPPHPNQNIQQVMPPQIEPRISNSQSGNPINVRASRTQPNDNDCISKFQSLIPVLKTSLNKVFVMSSEAISQQKSYFENSFENLMGDLDKAEMYLQLAKNMQMQIVSDRQFTLSRFQDYDVHRQITMDQIRYADQIRETLSLPDRSKINNVDDNIMEGNDNIVDTDNVRAGNTDNVHAGSDSNDMVNTPCKYVNRDNNDVLNNCNDVNNKGDNKDNCNVNIDKNNDNLTDNDINDNCKDIVDKGRDIVDNGKVILQHGLNHEYDYT
ncbi:hypothetical protein Ahia01_000765300 [Argonauta hians]